MPQYFYTTQGTASQAYLVCTTYTKLYSLVMYVYGMHNCAEIERKFETEVGYLISRLLYTLYTHIHKASRPCLFSNKVALISIPRTTNYAMPRFNGGGQTTPGEVVSYWVN